MSACASRTQTLAVCKHEYECAHACSHSACISKRLHVCLQVPTQELHASLHTEGAETMHTSSPVCLCQGTAGHMDMHLFIYSTNV